MGACCPCLKSDDGTLANLYDEPTVPYMEEDESDFQPYTGGSKTLYSGKKGDKYHSTNEVKIEDFKIVKVIGRGSFGKVYLVNKVTDGQYYAMKVLKKDMILRQGQELNTKGKRLLVVILISRTNDSRKNHQPFYCEAALRVLNT